MLLTQPTILQSGWFAWAPVLQVAASWPLAADGLPTVRLLRSDSEPKPLPPPNTSTPKTSPRTRATITPRAPPPTVMPPPGTPPKRPPLSEILDLRGVEGSLIPKAHGLSIVPARDRRQRV